MEPQTVTNTKLSPLKERIYRRRFLLPNAVTLGNLFCGFLSIIYSSSMRYEKAILAIGVAIVLDGLDGRLARRLQATSKFGVEFDSFSDLISFGLAPAMLVYNWGFRIPADEFGVLITFIYSLCAASRLARFNIQHENLQGFSGLPTPGAAALVVTSVEYFVQSESSFTLRVVTAALMLSLSFLMVSQIEFLSLKKLKVTGPALFILLGALIAFIWYLNIVGLLVVAWLYVLSGPVLWLAKRARRNTLPQAS